MNTITVFGKSWQRRLISDFEVTGNKPGQIRNIVFHSGTFELLCAIRAALGDDCLWYCDEGKIINEKTGLLRELSKKKPEKEKFYRVSREWGTIKLGTPIEIDPAVFAQLQTPKKTGGDVKFSIKKIIGFNNSAAIVINQQMPNETFDCLDQVLKSNGSIPIFWSLYSFDKNQFDEIQKSNVKVVQQDSAPEKNIFHGSTHDKSNSIAFLRMQRLTDAGIGKRDDLSLEACISGLISSFNRDERMKSLLKFRAIVVYAGVDYAFILTRKEVGKTDSLNAFEMTIVFRPLRTCDYYRVETGYLSGYSHIFLASCLKSYLSRRTTEKDKDWLKRGAEEAIAKSLYLFDKGYVIPENGILNPVALYADIYGKSASQKIDKDKKENKRARIRVIEFSSIPVEHDDPEIPWSLLQKQIQFKFKEKCSDPDKTPDQRIDCVLDILAKQIVTEGVRHTIQKFQQRYKEYIKPCEGCPIVEKIGRISFQVATFGKLIAVDPSEIHNYRYLQSLIRKYDREKKWNRPLGLAVFGPPGGGKSFGVKEVAKSIWEREKSDKLEVVECNLAQFTSPDELSRKLHDAQNYSLKGAMPLVFLDEFDSIFEGKPFGWFKYLLPLLQDGQFKMGDSIYDIGKSIVVCVGGLHRTLSEFASRQKENLFIDAKGPDLLSRLRGHVNTLGPNRYDELDRLYKIRRAVLLRSLLKQKMSSILKEEPNDSDSYKMLCVSPDVLHALLNVSEYRHGTRSIEALIEMSVSAYDNAPKEFVAAILPPNSQMEIHTHAIEFWQKITAYNERIK